MERKETISGAYRMTGGNSFYDGMITCTTLSGKAVCRLVWDMNKAECDAYLEKALSGVPDDFSGKLLEVPVGTGTAKYIRRMEKCLAEKRMNARLKQWFMLTAPTLSFRRGC